MKTGKRRLAAYLEKRHPEERTSVENVKSIEHAVELLPPRELAKFRRLFPEFDGHAWDRQIEKDSSSGKLDQLAAEALADYRVASAERQR